MKHKILYLLFLPLLLLASCNNDEEINNTDSSQVAVQFRAGNIATPHAKNTASAAAWTANDKFGIFMIAHEATSIGGNIHEDVNNIEHWTTVGASQDNFNLVSYNPIYYPQNGDKVNFIAYYPYTTPLTNHIYPINVSSQTNSENIDVLHAKATNTGNGYDKKSGVVNMEFKHALSKLSFTLKAGTGSPNLAGAKIEISNLYTHGDLNLSDGTVSTSGSVQTLTAQTTSNGQSSSAIVIPQSLSGAKLIITLADNKSKFESIFTTTAFEEGKNHTYIVTVDKTGITVVTGDIIPWINKKAPPIEGAGGIHYKVGDYYPDPKATRTDGGATWIGTKPIGVVFWLDPSDSRHGKVVGLEEIAKVWAWGLLENRATDENNGRINMRKVLEKVNNPDNIFHNHPAFQFADGLNQGIATNGYSDPDAMGIWYIPALNELVALYVAHNSYGKSSFNSKLTMSGGSGLDGDWYWSSSENNLNSAFFVDFFNGDQSLLGKDTSCSVRCVLAF